MNMRTHVEFRSDKFPSYPDEEKDTNPDLWGKRLAEYLQQKLQEQGIDTERILAEDWGWTVTIRHEAFPLWVGCGRYQEYPDGYLVFIEPSRPTVRKGLFGKIDTSADVGKVANAIDRILKSEPDIHDVRWWTEGDK
jgi:hypothetical protein